MNVIVIYCRQTGTSLFFHVAWFPLPIMNMSFFFFFLPFFIAVFTLSHSHRVAHCGINGCVQLSGVKQVVKGSYVILSNKAWTCAAARLTVACLPAAPLPSNGTNYPATWVKQGNIHFKRKLREKERKHLDSTGWCLPSLEAIRTNRVPSLNVLLSLSRFTLLEPRTSSHHLYQLWFPPLFSVAAEERQIWRVREGRKTPDTTEGGSWFERQREHVVPSARGDLSSSDYRCALSAQLSPVLMPQGLSITRNKGRGQQVFSLLCCSARVIWLESSPQWRQLLNWLWLIWGHPKITLIGHWLKLKHFI